MLLYPFNLKWDFFLVICNRGGGGKVVCERLCLYFGWVILPFSGVKEDYFKLYSMGVYALKVNYVGKT